MRPLINNQYRLERFQGKGGWTYARISEIKKDESKPFGWRKVKGTIDGYELKKYSLMPVKGGGLFLPVKAEIRKQINKKEGDWVHIILYPDTDELAVPEELQLCLDDEPRAKKFFNSLTESERKFYIDRILAAKREETRVNRLAKTINRLQQGMKLYDKFPE